ncbi:hypothetical protein X975_09096, partial [Stegodyphus mimosarum]
MYKFVCYYLSVCTFSRLPHSCMLRKFVPFVHCLLQYIHSHVYKFVCYYLSVCTFSRLLHSCRLENHIKLFLL